jgi:hypothetical protein
MTSLDEVIVDELRFPRMFNTLRRGGMYRRCDCAGCPPCRNAAQRLLRGIASSGKPAGFYRPEQWGDRYRVYSRPLGSQTVSVLTDMSTQPTVVDVNVGDSNDDTATQLTDGQDEEFALRALIAQGLGPSTQKFAQQVKQMQVIDKDNNRVDLRTIRFSKPFTMDSLNTTNGINQIPKARGIYLIQGPSGQRLGEAGADHMRDLRSRIQEHVNAYRKKHGAASLPSYRVYYSIQDKPRIIENAILTALTKLKAHPAGQSVADRFKALNMPGNKQREHETL